MDTELFELCKEVYTRTKWGDDFEIPGLDRGLNWYHRILTDGLRYDIPRFTSDYLLEKLYEHKGKTGLVLYHVHSTMKWEAFYAGKFFEYGTDTQHWDTQGDTPKEALLRLVIALDDAGELK